MLRNVAPFSADSDRQTSVMQHTSKWQQVQWNEKNELMMNLEPDIFTVPMA